MALEVRVEQGDAAAVRGQPALVVPANRQLTLGWGSHLAEKVARLAGPGVEAEALGQHPRGVALGEAVLTSAGSLPGFTHLLHAAVLDKYDFNPLFLLRLRERTSEATLRAAVANSLRLADLAGLSGLVLTPMGAGIGGMPMAKCARLLLDEVRRFEAAEPAALSTVVLAAHEARDAEILRRAAQERTPAPGDAS